MRGRSESGNLPRDEEAADTGAAAVGAGLLEPNEVEVGEDGMDESDKTCIGEMGLYGR